MTPILVYSEIRSAYNSAASFVPLRFARAQLSHARWHVDTPVQEVELKAALLASKLVEPAAYRQRKHEGRNIHWFKWRKPIGPDDSSQQARWLELVIRRPDQTSLGLAALVFALPELKTRHKEQTPTGLTTLIKPIDLVFQPFTAEDILSGKADTVAAPVAASPSGLILPA